MWLNALISGENKFESHCDGKMADENRAKTDFEQILNGLNRKFDIIHVKWLEEKHFEVKFRTQIPRNSEDFNQLCDEWVDLFSNITSTVWAKKISNTGPKIRFRKQYQCWTHGGKEVQKELLFDARRCKATLDIKVLTDNPLTRRKNKHIRLGLNVVVKINFIHHHPVDKTVPYSFFVHNCEPLPEPPKPIIQPNERLPQLVAEMVHKGLKNSQENRAKLASEMLKQQTPETNTQGNQTTVYQMPTVEQPNVTNVQIVHEPLKLPVTQVVVAAPQIDVSEHLLMCQQTLMFDPSTVIPVTLPPHFVTVHNNVYNQGQQFL